MPASPPPAAPDGTATLGGNPTLHGPLTCGRYLSEWRCGVFVRCLHGAYVLARHVVHRVELVRRCGDKRAKRSGSAALPEDPEGPPFIQQLIDTVRDELVPRAEAVTPAPDLAASAARHGADLLRAGFSVEQVVHDYGDLCQALTELAGERGMSITVDEFHTFNRCLDDATADAVSEFTRIRDRTTAESDARATNERLGDLAHELRNQLNSAMLAFQAIKSGVVPVAGATGSLLDRSHRGLRDLIDRSLADVRLTAELPLRCEQIAIDQLLAEVRIPVVIDAASQGLAFSSAVEQGLVIAADRQMISSAVANLLQNALKFTRPSGTVLLTACAAADRILLEVEDACGGLAADAMERMFRPFARNGDGRAGLGLGLSISRRAVEANGGKLQVRNLPGQGCIFTIDLPRSSAVS